MLTQVQAQINEGGQVLLEALMTGDTEKLDAVLDSLNSKGSVISREAMHLVRLAMVEIGHAIVQMEPKQIGYIVGTVAYEAVETAVLVAIEAGLAAATVGTAGGATPATAGGTAAIVAAKAAAFSKLVNRLSERADLLDFPKIAKAIDRLNEMVVWMIKYPMCFVAGTKVHTLSGLKNIEDIQRDDWVLTRDEHNPTSENRFRRVTELFQTNPSRLLTIRHIRKSEDKNPLAQKYSDDLRNKLEKDALPLPGLKNGKLAGKLHPKTGVPFDTDGFPTFESAGNVKLPSHMIGKSVTDHSQFRESSRMLWELIKNDDVKRSAFTADQLKAIERGDSTIQGYTWHHHQDGKTMQLVDEVDHALTGHFGGRQLTGGRS